MGKLEVRIWRPVFLEGIEMRVHKGRKYNRKTRNRMRMKGNDETQEMSVNAKKRKEVNESAPKNELEGVARK